MAEQSTNSESNFTTPADVRQIFKEELQGYFGPRGPESVGGAGGKSNLPVGEVGVSGWSVNREIESISRTSRVEASIEYLGKQMVDGFARMDKRFEDLIHYMDKRFEQMDKRFEQIDKRFEQMDKRFEQIDKRFEELIHHTDTRFQDLIHQMDKRFEQVDKRFEDLIHHMDKRFSLIQWTMGIGFTMMTVLMSVYHFLG